MADKGNPELRLWWIIGILLSMIVALVSYSTHRETGRLDIQIRVIHERINDVIKTKADKEDVQRELNYVWKIVDRKEDKCTSQNISRSRN